jgi:hypothetical protein
MTESRSAWQEAVDSLAALGGTLRAHYEQQRDAGGEQDQAEVSEAVHRLGRAVQDTFEAMGQAANDPAVQQDVRAVGRSLADALAVTFAEVADDLRTAFAAGQDRDRVGSAPPASDRGPQGAGPRAAQSSPTGDTDESAERHRDEGVEPWGTP